MDDDFGVLGGERFFVFVWLLLLLLVVKILFEVVDHNIEVCTSCIVYNYDGYCNYIVFSVEIEENTGVCRRVKSVVVVIVVV